ncbi:MAG: RsmD family RNA methyltransferase [Balneolaceae bacterium]|nr:RsmD family RNA methyltransferase [Balneolaceae bacterium]MBO6546375.1 RsmD family RNA methyltransferase [Balneolaceae bacterium]MBO6648734.1 RsmD family RNA methyltransferase [Balneolaceae bacterium]
MISKINNPEVIRFIQEHANNDPATIALQARKYPELPIREIAIQIASRQKSESKLPEWWGNPQVIFPPKENLEQASSEITAKFKSRWIEGNSILDLTGGSGVDLFYMSSGFERVVYVEPNKELAAITEFNFKLFGRQLEAHIAKAGDILSKIDSHFDVIYLDPSRRDFNKKRVFGLEEYQPNVVELYELLIEKGNEVVIKTSPMIDIKSTLELLPDTFKAQVLAVDNEVKEVLFYLKKDTDVTPQIEAWNISELKPDQKFAFTLEEENEAASEYSNPMKYIYEPNSAIRKAGAFNLTGTKFGLRKLHPNTHLYTSEIIIENFPGRVFEVLELIKPNKKEIKKVYPKGIVNVISKNFPMGANKIKKKFRLKDGREEFLVFCTISKEKKIALQTRITHS